MFDSPQTIEDAAKMLARTKVAAEAVGGFYKKAAPVDLSQLAPIGIGAGIGGLGGLIMGRRSKRRVNPLWPTLGGAALGAGLGAGYQALNNAGSLSNPSVHNISTPPGQQLTAGQQAFNALPNDVKFRAAEEETLYKQLGPLGLGIGRLGGQAGVSGLSSATNWIKSFAGTQPKNWRADLPPEAVAARPQTELLGEGVSGIGSDVIEAGKNLTPEGAIMGGAAGIGAFKGMRNINNANRLMQWGINKDDVKLKVNDTTNERSVSAPIQKMLDNISAAGERSTMNVLPGGRAMLRGAEYAKHMRTLSKPEQSAVLSMVGKTPSGNLRGKLSRGAIPLVAGYGAGNLATWLRHQATDYLSGKNQAPAQ